MSLKNLKLSSSGGEREVHPRKIFDNITLRGSIKNIWDPQAEALRNWYKKRTIDDVVIEMNTGGGKTLVGLLIAQSLLHELNRRVVYVVANNQLVEQTIKRAHELAIKPASRYNFAWHRQDEFLAAETFCITNYAAVFNGYSTFKDKDIGAFIFDDAHVAEASIRDRFTLTITPDSVAFDKIVNLFKPHFSNTYGMSRLEDISEGSQTSLLFVPMYAVWKHAQELRNILVEVDVPNDKNLKYVWSHLSDHLQHCCVIISARGIEISPSVIPLHTLPYFQSDVRRVYLTATLPSQASFARTFGLLNPEVVTPGGKSGDAQRLFLFASGESDEDQRDATLSLIEDEKACVISPSTSKAKQWPSEIFDKNEGDDAIEEFANSDESRLLGLVARYDGIDLPGDACRILILDRLPRGESLFERFIDEGTNVDAIRVGHTATRIVQAIGRIFRSNTDHGAVILVGCDLKDWILNPKNRSYLPILVQQQISFGIELKKEIEKGEVTEDELLHGVLTGDEDWDNAYKQYIDSMKTMPAVATDDWYPQMLLDERKAYRAIWDGDFSSAIDVYSELSDRGNIKDKKLGAWYKQFEGLAHLCCGDQQTALQAFADAAANRSDLIRPSEHRDRMFKPPKVATVGFQAQVLAAMYRSQKVKMASWINTVQQDLVYGDETDKAEKAMELLGKLLGLESTCHDKEGGPDNLWVGKVGEVQVWGFDLKTGKKRSSTYSKTEIGQSHIHAQWVKDKFSSRPRRHAIIGYELEVSNLASPPAELYVIDLTGFQDIASRVAKVLGSVDAGNKEDLESSFEGWLGFHGLLWPNVVLCLPTRKAQDLKAD
ncbi:MAG: hypothetical protein CME33_04325 [Gimesia sp.]|uniref:DEAD/DEAH box helicase family protein n=1 Tax=Gimesia sp. TaxID=2024833 RepID=UPI000C604C0B|nr:DEAD/DEAH box helicase family protein [Gimesia sp.]MAX35779.1 hypothetical protein [Gimesia sp.]|tara:strand:+ start:19558 stop:22044 length:2487 start_codon:yes stop_codon:yes gene_type:complete